MKRLIALARRIVVGAAALAAVIAVVPRAVAQEGPFEPWVGERGITETVAEIMARDALTKPWSPEDGLKMVEEHYVDRRGLPQNPDSPAVPMWPWTFGQKPMADFASTGRHGGPFNPQTVSTSFIGPRLSESGFIPPDTTGAVGPTQILICANGRIKVYNKTGTVGALNVTVDSFFTSVRGGIQVSDPQVKYDPISQRWIVVAINVSSTNNRVVIAVSNATVITNTASFTFYFFQQNLVAPAGNTGEFADHPKAGVDANAVYIGCNMFNSTFHTTGWVVMKSSILSGGPIQATAFRNLATGTSGLGPYTPMGVDNDDPASTEGYFLGTANDAFSKLTMRRISNPGGAPTISGNLQITVPTTVSPQAQPASGSGANNLDAIDDRISYCSIRLNRATGVRTLFAAHQIEVNASGIASTVGNRNGSRWYELQNLTATPSLRQSGTLFDPAAANPKGYWFPACVMSGQGHMAIGASCAGVTEFAHVEVSGRLRTDTLGTIQAATVAQTSSTAYNVQAGTQRWGDYAQAWVDPTDDQTIWMFAEYCDATNSWAERAIKLLAPPPALPATCSPANVAQGASNVDVVVVGSSINGSAFYDTQPGVNRLLAAVSGTGVTVNSVTFSHATPTQFTMNISVGGAAATGARNVTATNPDGQVATGNGILTIDPSSGTCPSFTQQPSPQNVCSGNPVSFTVAANGSPAPTFQWRKDTVNLSNGGNISGATTATLTINPAGTGDAGSYDCVASNGCAGGPTTSNAAALTVDSASSFTQQPSPQTVCSGSSASFTVAATGSPAPSFQWRKDGGNLVDGGNISGATTATLTINPVGAADDGSYDCVATNSCGGPATSNAAALTVNTVASIDTQPVNQQGRVTQARSFSAVASGTGPITYQWRRDLTNLLNGGSISGADTATLTIDPLAMADAGSYDCVVSNPCGNVISSAATLEVFCHADYNMDGFIDGIDYDMFNNDFESTDPEQQIRADYNGDGFVDGIDYDQFNNDFEGTGGC